MMCHGDGFAQYEMDEVFLRRRQRERAQTQDDARFAVRWLCGLALLHALLLLVPLFGNSWNHTRFVGFGSSLVTVRTSMFSMEVNIACDKNFVEDRLCKLASPLNGTHSISRARSLACAVSERSCSVISWLFWTNLQIFVFFLVAASFHVAAACTLHHYWEERPVADMRMNAMVFIFLAPFTAALGLCIWSFVTPDLGEISAFWSSQQAQLVLGFEPVDRWPFGWCWFMSLFCIGTSFLTILIWPCFFTVHEKEKNEEDGIIDEMAIASAMGAVTYAQDLRYKPYYHSGAQPPQNEPAYHYNSQMQRGAAYQGAGRMHGAASSSAPSYAAPDYGQISYMPPLENVQQAPMARFGQAPWQGNPPRYY